MFCAALRVSTLAGWAPDADWLVGDALAAGLAAAGCVTPVKLDPRVSVTGPALPVLRVAGVAVRAWLTAYAAPAAGVPG